ncbi:MAG: EexN family lipoprotein [Pseudomonadota bacterium]
MTTWKPIRYAIGVAFVTLVVGCAKEPQPRTVSDFLDDPIGLEATLARCNANRSRTRGEPECKNAREANKRLAADREAELQARFEAESQRKLEQIRARNEAAEAARRRAEEAARLREELAYEQQFQAGPDDDPSGAVPAPSGEVVGAPAGDIAQPITEQPVDDADEPPAGNDPEAASLDELREELDRRNQEAKNGQR